VGGEPNVDADASSDAHTRNRDAKSRAATVSCGRTTGEQATGAIPRTGSGLPLEMLVAVLLIAAGGVLRTRLPAGPA
jgi:hypothetical protein